MAETRYVFRMTAALAGRDSVDAARMSALVDGRVLADLLLRLDRRFFGRALLATTGPATGVLRVALLRRMHMRMLAYGREVLGEDWSRLPTPDLDVLARAPFKTTALPDGPLFDSTLVLRSAAGDLWDGFIPEAVVAMRTLCLVAIHAAVVADGPLRREVFALLDALIHDQETRIGIESWLEEFRSIVTVADGSPPLTPVALCADKRTSPIVEAPAEACLVDPKPRLRLSHVIGVQSVSDSDVSGPRQPLVPRQDASVDAITSCTTAEASVLASVRVSNAAVETDRQPAVNNSQHLAAQLADAEAVQLRLRIRCDEAEMALAVQAERERLLAEASSEREASLTAALASQMERAMNAEAALSATENRAARLTAELARARSMHVSVLGDLERTRSERSELLDRLAATLTSVEDSSCALGELQKAAEAARARAAGFEERLAWTTQTFHQDAQEMEQTIAEHEATIAEQASKIAALESCAASSRVTEHLRTVLGNRIIRLRKAKRSLALKSAALLAAEQKLCVASAHRRRLSKKLRKLWKRYYALVHATSPSMTVVVPEQSSEIANIQKACSVIDASVANDDVQSRVHVLEHALASAAVTMADAQHSVQGQRVENDALFAENERLRALITRHEACSDRETSLLADFEAAQKAERKMYGLVESLTRDLAARASTEARLRQRLSDMTVALETLRVDLNFSDTANTIVASPLKLAYDESSRSAANELDYNFTLASVISKHDQISISSADTAGDANASEDALRSSVAALKNENSLLQSELRELDARIAEFRSDLEVAEREDAERDERIAQLVSERNDLMLKAAESALSAAEFEQQHNDVVAHLNTILAERDELIAAEVELLESMDDLQQQLDDALAAKDALETELAKLTDALGALEHRSRQLEGDLDAANTARRMIEGDLEQTQKAFERLGSECAALRRQSIHSSDEPNDSTSDELALRIEQLLDELRTAADIESDLQAQIADLDARRRAAEYALEHQPAPPAQNFLEHQPAPPARDAFEHQPAPPAQNVFENQPAPLAKGVDACCATEDARDAVPSSAYGLNQYSAMAAEIGGRASTADELRALVASIRREHCAILAAWHSLGSRVYGNTLVSTE